MEQIAALNEEFGCELKIEMFKSSSGDYMSRPTKREESPVEQKEPQDVSW